MKYYSLPAAGARTVNLPPLSGGINLRDGENIGDNQLSDALNVWYKDGMIHTRPGMTSGESFCRSIAVPIRQKSGKIKSYPEIIRDGKTLISISVLDITEYGRWQQIDYFFWLNENGISNVVRSVTYDKDSQSALSGFLAFEYNGYIWLLYQTGTIKKKLIDNWDGEFSNIDNNEIYVPTVYHHCKAKSNQEYTGVQIEGYNLIGTHYKMIYSTVNRDLLVGGTTQVDMIYPLPKAEVTTELNGRKFKAEITDKNGVTTTHEVTLQNGYGQEEATQADNLIMRVVLGSHVWFFTGNQEHVYLTESDWVEDNMVFTVPYLSDSADRDKVYKMTCAKWFGGASVGKRGGTRLFLAGNIQEENKAMLVWSGLNNPLYFSENCWSAVGNKEQSITALGKQNDKLIIFKPDEMYYTYYATGSEITEDNLINQEIIDYDANAVLFPLVTISSDTGCDAPDSICSCRGRLVWANGDGHIYTLASLNSYNTALGVFVISEMIDSALSKLRSNIAGAKGADLDGHYALIVGKTAFVCDYSTTGFRYISSYTSKSDANAKIPWYKWELPDAGLYCGAGCLICAGKVLYNADTAYIVSSVLSINNEADSDSYYVLENGIEINEAEIPSFFESKHFSFGLPERYKQIKDVNISFCDNGGRDILFEVLTERGTAHSKSFINIATSENKRALSYTRNRIFRSVAPMAAKVCLRVSSYGALGVSAASITYKVIGGVK